MDINRNEEGPVIEPARIHAAEKEWREPPLLEFYVDFETVSDLLPIRFAPPSASTIRPEARSRPVEGSGTINEHREKRMSWRSILSPMSWVQPWALLMLIPPPWAPTVQNATPLMIVSSKAK